MSLCAVGSLEVDSVGSLASKEELAIVPDIQGIHYMFCDSSNQKRYRNYSDCLSGEEEEEERLNLQDCDTFTAPSSSKRLCSNNNYSVICSPDTFQPTTSIDKVESFAFGASPADIDFLACGPQSSPQSSTSSIPPSSFNFAASPSAACKPIQGTEAFDSINLLAEMQRPTEVLSHQQSATLSPESYKLMIKEQPEEYYRARYDSEGVRAPLKGLVENYPAVQVFGPDYRYGRIDVKLVHEDGTPHTSCSLDASEGRKNAVMKKIGPFNRMIAEFEDLRIRRVKKEGRKKPAGGEKSAPKDGRSDKIASLLFTVVLETDHGEIVQSVKSRPISLTTAPEPAELDWLEPNRGHFAGQESLVIKGSKMTSPKVTFRITLPDGRRQELHGSVDKERSHQNVLLVKTPSLNQLSYQFAPQTIRAEVIVITGRNQMPSNSLPFDFIPNNVCRECMQETPTYTVCNSTYPSTAPPPPAQRANSPPATPGLPPQPSSPPTNSGIRAQMPTPNPPLHMVTQSGYSQSIVSPSATTRTLVSPPELVPTFSEPNSIASVVSTAGKSGDEFMFIMQDLMRQECANSNAAAAAASMGIHQKDLETHYMYSSASYGQQLEGVSSPYIPPATSPSSASDQPCYSPITPVQSPLSANSWGYIDQMLNNLYTSQQISQQQYQILHDHCTKQLPYLLQAFKASQSNESSFLQVLASIKPTQSFQTTH